MGKGFFLGFEKRAWDSDIDERGRYGIAANRTVGGNGYVYDALRRASKDDKLEVTILGPKADFSSRDKDFKSKFKELRSELGPRPKNLTPGRMDWNRNYSWLITGNKKDKRFHPPGDIDPERTEERILNYIHEKVQI